MGRVKQLDAIRFIMVWLIIISHFTFIEKFSYGNFYMKYIHNPTIAVDYFFLLSGFGIFVNWHNKNLRFESALFRKGWLFATSKIKKMYFPYILSLLLCLIHVYIMRAGKYGQAKALGITGINFGICATLLQSLTGISTFTNAINPVCWFLSTLYISYILCPYFYEIVRRLKSVKNCVFYLGGGVTVILLLTIAFEAIQSKAAIFGMTFDTLAYGSPYIRCWYLLIGMVLAKIFMFQKENEMTDGSEPERSPLPDFTSKQVCRQTCGTQDYKYKDTILEIGTAALAISWILFRNSLGWNLAANRILDLAICIMFVYIMALGRGRLSAGLAGGRLVSLGNDTMYFFLMQYPAIYLVTDLADLMIKKSTDLTGIMEAIFTAAAVAASAYFLKAVTVKLRRKS